jgi:hypothetical protein
MVVRKEKFGSKEIIFKISPEEKVCESYSSTITALYQNFGDVPNVITHEA